MKYVTTSRSIVLLSAILIAVSVFSFRSVAVAGPVTGGTGNWPYVKLGIYQGVAALSVNGQSIIELGANGKDIATGSGTPIAIRPNSVAATAAAVATSYNGATRLKLPGRICLFPSGIGGAAECHDRWPVGSTSLWTSSTDAEGFSVLTPIPNGATQLGVLLGTAGSPITSGTALTVQQTPAIGTHTLALRATNLVGGSNALLVNGGTRINGTLNVNGRMYINSQEVFTSESSQFHVPGNQGIGSGLDADLLDGYNVTIEDGPRCGGLACICFTSQANVKKCAKLLNKF